MPPGLDPPLRPGERLGRKRAALAHATSQTHGAFLGGINMEGGGQDPARRVWAGCPRPRCGLRAGTMRSCPLLGMRF